MKIIQSIIASLLFIITGCAGQNIKDYSAQKPKLDLRKYLNGELEAWGTIHDWRGRITDSFYVTMKGKWQGNEGTLEENFTFQDGRKEKRVWKVVYQDDNNFTAQAHDTVGIARGKQYGNTVNMNYVLRVPVKGKTYDITLDDWLYLVDEKHLINRTVMKKFGFSVGSLTIGFNKK